MIILDDQQKKAITAKSPVIVNASAGSGKTGCLIAKILQLLKNGTDPKNICAITFTNKAANEMKERLKNQPLSTSGMQISTIHSLCVRIIKTFIKYTYLNYPFSIYDDSDQLSIIKTIIKAHKLDEEPKKYISVISNAKSKQQTDLLEKDYKKVYNIYTDILFKNNACDFDDLLTFAFDCLKHKECSEYFTNLWHHILVDEFQDTSIIQYKIIELLYNSEKTKTLFIVGDLNQSIYSWRSANPENVHDFIKKYNPSVCYLTYNYRSSQSIINHANNFLQYGKPMITKSSSSGKVSFSRFSNQEEEAKKIASALIQIGDYENTAILFRINARSLLFEKVFSQKKIPYKIVGALPFYRRRVVKDLISYCKSSLNKSDLESLVRIVNVPKRGFGEKKQEQLLYKGWSYLEKVARELPLIKSFIDLLNKIATMKPLKAIEEILYHTNYRDYLKTDSDRILLDSFLDVVSGFNSLEELILASTFIEKDSGHGVKLMTAHASKGLEFNNVFVVGVEAGLWPHKFSNNLKEEERLYYVACTRAKKWLNISYTQSKIYRGQSIEVLPSPLFFQSYKKLSRKSRILASEMN